MPSPKKRASAPAEPIVDTDVPAVVTGTIEPAPDVTAVALAQITLSAEKYVAAVYQPFGERLTSAIESVKAIDYDITTTAGMAVAVKARATFRELRVAAEKERKASKAPILTAGRLLESGYVSLEERIVPFEELFDADIKAEEKRKADAKAEAERVAAALAALIRAKIDLIRAIPAKHRASDSVTIRAELTKLAECEITEEEFGKLTGEAALAVEATGQELLTMFNAAAQAEQAEAARLEQVAETERKLAAQEEANRKEAERLAALQREHELAQAERDRLAGIEAAKLAAAAAETQRQLAEATAQIEAARIESENKLAAQRAELEEEMRAFEAKRAAQVEADRIASIPVGAVADILNAAEQVPEPVCQILVPVTYDPVGFGVVSVDVGTNTEPIRFDMELPVPSVAPVTPAPEARAITALRMAVWDLLGGTYSADDVRVLVETELASFANLPPESEA